MEVFRENKRTIMGTAAAVLTVGVAYWLYRAADDEDEDYDSDEEVNFDAQLESLMPVQHEEGSNYLDFEYFLKIFEMSQGQARKKAHKTRSE